MHKARSNQDVNLDSVLLKMSMTLDLSTESTKWSPDCSGIDRFVKKSNGIRIQELEAGSGEVAQTGDVVVVDYVLRRSNGYFIYS